jgi:DNA-binding SARP family transcriptional activator
MAGSFFPWRHELAVARALLYSHGGSWQLRHNGVTRHHPGARMFFGYLGSLLTEPATALAPRQRTVLAVLLTRAGRPVPVDELAEFVWDGTPPARAAQTLRTYVMRLRHALGEAAGIRIVTRDPGYLIEAAEDEVDALQFARACRDGATAYKAGQWAVASAALADGLALWRGEPLADISSRLLRDTEVPALQRQRLQARQWRIDADLQLGGGDELAAELHELTSQEPLRERLYVLLMTALSRAGRASEALAVYQQARNVLVAQLGIEPGPDLRELQRLILAGEQPRPRPAARISPEKYRPVPHQLPAAAGHFAGREADLKELDAIQDRAGPVTISSIGGMAGIGKTTLALHWAHQVADRFPDGQLYVNLRGFGPAPPMTPADALRGFLDALRDPAKPLPADPDMQEALYRSLTADRRILIVLDNARDEQQVRPLLPGSASCLTLITSRSQLAGLVATNGAIPLSLDPLTTADAHEFLSRRLGPQRLAGEPAAVDRLIASCAGLPLALCIAAARAALTPALSLTTLSAQLSEPGLDALSGTDPYADLRSVFSWSYRRLSPEAARLFRCLSLFPGPDFSATATASIDPAGRTYELQAELTSAHLLEEYLPGRFRLHDLLARYAQECSARDDTEDARREVRGRILTWYSAAAASAARIVDPHRHSIPDPGQPHPIPAGLADEAQALLDRCYLGKMS